MNKIRRLVLGGMALLGALPALAQKDTVEIESNGRTVTEIFDSLASGLIPGRVPFGVLYDRVYPWTGLTDSTAGDTVTAAGLYQSWFDLEVANYDNKVRVYESMRAGTAGMLYDQHLPLLVVNYDFATLDPKAKDDGRLALVNGIITDNGNGAPPYLVHHVGMAGLGTGEVDENVTYTLAFDEVQLLINGTDVVTGLAIEDLATGMQYTLQAGQSTTLAFSGLGERFLRVTAAFASGQVQESIHRLKVKFNWWQYPAAGACDSGTTEPVLESTIPFKGYTELVGTTSIADWHIFYHYMTTNPQVKNCGNKLSKPVIVLDGFDPLDERNYKELYFDYLRYYDYDSGTNENLGEKLRRLGYDVIVLNFPVAGSDAVGKYSEAKDQYGNPVSIKDRDGGADYIERNAFLLVQLIRQVNDSLAANGSSEKLRIIGPSMGGQIARYALAYMEKQKQLNPSNPAWEHNTRLYASFDSPHDGANIPLAIQRSLHFFGYTGQQQESKDAYDKKINSPAAQQLLIEHLNGQNNSSSFRSQYAANLNGNGKPNSHGWPTEARKVGIINGGGGGHKNHIEGQKFVDIEPDLAIQLFRIEDWFLPQYGQTATYSKNKVFVGSLFSWGFVTSSFPVTNNNSRGTMDVVPGSTNNTQGDIVDEVSKSLKERGQKARINTVVPNHTFIPTVSALAFKTPIANWYLPVNLQDLVCNNKTYYDNIYIQDSNQAHVYVSRDNAEWGIQEIQRGTLNCPVICGVTKGSWPNPVCDQTTTDYSIAGVPPGYIVLWETPTPTNLTINSFNATPVGGVSTANVSIHKLGYYMPTRLIARVVNPCGADVVIREEISVTQAVAPAPTISSVYTAGHLGVTLQFGTPPPNVTYNWTVTKSPNPVASVSGTGPTCSVSLTGTQRLMWSIHSTTTGSCGEADNYACYRKDGEGLVWEDCNLVRQILLPDANNISVLPNPTHDAWNFRFVNKDRQPQTLVIVDAFGRKVYSAALVEPASHRVDCGGWATGLYVATVQFDTGETEVLKLSKQ